MSAMTCSSSRMNYVELRVGNVERNSLLGIGKCFFKEEAFELALDH